MLDGVGSRRESLVFRRESMIVDDAEFELTLDRIRWFQEQLLELRQVKMNLSTYRTTASGFLKEIDKMQKQVREYLDRVPTEQFESVGAW
jgi:hypothetical protein